MKAIKSELYIKHISWEQVERQWNNFLKEFQSLINGDVTMYDGTYKNEKVIGIDLELKSPTFKECEANFILSKKLVLKYFNQIPSQITKIKLENYI